MHDLGLAEVVLALKVSQHYLYSVKCVMNYHSLKHQFTQKDLDSRQRRLMELLNDYDITIQCHLGKANVVEDTSMEKW